MSNQKIIVRTLIALCAFGAGYLLWSDPFKYLPDQDIENTSQRVPASEAILEPAPVEEGKSPRGVEPSSQSKPQAIQEASPERAYYKQIYHLSAKALLSDQEMMVIEQAYQNPQVLKIALEDLLANRSEQDMNYAVDVLVKAYRLESSVSQHYLEEFLSYVPTNSRVFEYQAELAFKVVSAEPSALSWVQGAWQDIRSEQVLSRLGFLEN